MDPRDPFGGFSRRSQSQRGSSTRGGYDPKDPFGGFALRSRQQDDPQSIIDQSRKEQGKGKKKDKDDDFDLEKALDEIEKNQQFLQPADFTRLAEAQVNNDSEVVKEIRDRVKGEANKGFAGKALDFIGGIPREAWEAGDRLVVQPLDALAGNSNIENDQQQAKEEHDRRMAEIRKRRESGDLTMQQALALQQASNQELMGERSKIGSRGSWAGQDPDNRLRIAAGAGLEAGASVAGGLGVKSLGSALLGRGGAQAARTGALGASRSVLPGVGSQAARTGAATASQGAAIGLGDALQGDEFTAGEALQKGGLGAVLGGGLGYGLSRGVGAARNKFNPGDTFNDTITFGKDKLTVSKAKSKTKSAAQTANEKLMNRHSSFTRLANQYQKMTGKTIEGIENPSDMIKLYAGTRGQVAEKVRELEDIVGTLGSKDMAADLERYGLARRLLNDRPEIRTDSQLRKARNTVDEIEGKYSEDQLVDIEAAYQNLNDYSGSLLDLRVREGLLTAEDAAMLKANNPDYFARIEILEKIDEGKNLTNKTMNVRDSGVQRQKGFGDDQTVMSPYASLFRETTRTYQMAAKNRVGRSLSRLSDSDLVKVAKEADDVPDGFERIAYRDEGVQKYLDVPQDVAESYMGLTDLQSDIITDFVGKTGQFFRKSATQFRPVFTLVSNPSRDFKAFLTNSRTVPVRRALFDWTAAVFDGLLDTQAAREFRQMGGGQSGFIFNSTVKDSEKFAKRLQSKGGSVSARQVVTSPAQLYKRIGEALENAPRVAEYKGARRQDISPERAAVMGREVTVDFAQAGSVGQQLNRWVPFLNARLQGTKRLATAFKENPTRALSVYAATTAAPIAALTYHNINNYKDIYDDIKDYEKDGYFVFIYGDGQDENGKYTDVIKVKKSEIDLALGNPVQNQIERMLGNDPQSLAGSAIDALSSISPIDFARDGEFDGSRIAGGLLPPIAKGAFEDTANKNFFFDSEIVPDYMEDLPVEEQVWDSDSTLSRTLGDAFGISPRRVENFVNSTFGPTPADLSDPSSLIEAFVDSSSRVGGGEKESQFRSLMDTVVKNEKSTSREITEQLENDNYAEASRLARAFNERVENLAKRYVEDEDKIDLSDAQIRLIDSLLFPMNATGENLSADSVRARLDR